MTAVVRELTRRPGSGEGRQVPGIVVDTTVPRTEKGSDQSGGHRDGRYGRWSASEVLVRTHRSRVDGILSQVRFGSTYSKVTHVERVTLGVLEE